MDRKLVVQLKKLVCKEKPAKVQVIVWLQGDQLDRGEKVFSLYKQGWAEKILITGNNTLVGKGKRPGENDLPLSSLKNWLLEKGVPRRAILVENRSLNTYEQATHTLQLCQKRRWKSLALVSSPYHQVRVFLTFLQVAKKYQTFFQFTNQPALNLSWGKNPSGREKTARELFQTEIKKIEAYSLYLVSPKEGIEYLNNIRNFDV